MYEIVFAGFGGQGILASGVILANAGMDEGKCVSWIPAYGAEQRGGTANCTVMIDDEEIGTPFYENPDILIAMNEPSLAMFKKIVKSDGLIIANSSLISKEKLKEDPRIVAVPAIDVAREVGDVRMANIIILGVLLNKIPVVSEHHMLEAIKAYFSSKGEKIILLNEKAYKRGSELVF